MGLIEEIYSRIDQGILARRKALRDYLGASSIGTECQRQLWYSFFQPKPVDDPQTLRKFDVGNFLEPLMVQYLQDAGFTLFTIDRDGKQFGFVDGQIAGSCDGVIKGIPTDENTPYLVEFKTANDFYFKGFKKSGISQNEKYAAQVQIYMGKLRLKKCLFMVLNKNTQEIYIEIVKFDEFEFTRLLEHAKLTLEFREPPGRHYPNKSYFKCKFCNYSKECWSETLQKV